LVNFITLPLTSRARYFRYVLPVELFEQVFCLFLSNSRQVLKFELEHPFHDIKAAQHILTLFNELVRSICKDIWKNHPALF